jgi:hypothetical protein
MSEPQVFTLPVVSDQTYIGKTVQLDGTRFVRCKFLNDCMLVYSGGLAQTSECYFAPKTKFAFQGQAAIVVQVMRELGWTISPP